MARAIGTLYDVRPEDILAWDGAPGDGAAQLTLGSEPPPPDIGDLSLTDAPSETEDQAGHGRGVGGTCVTCGIGTPGGDAGFASVAEQRDHFREDWHRYNVRRRAAGAAPLSRERFERLVQDSDADELGSLSGSGSDDDDGAGDGAGGTALRRSTHDPAQISGALARFRHSGEDVAAVTGGRVVTEW